MATTESLRTQLIRLLYAHPDLYTSSDLQNMTRASRSHVSAVLRQIAEAGPSVHTRGRKAAQFHLKPDWIEWVRQTVGPDTGQVSFLAADSVLWEVLQPGTLITEVSHVCDLAGERVVVKYERGGKSGSVTLGVESS